MTARVAINGFGRVGRWVTSCEEILRILKDDSLNRDLGTACPCTRGEKPVGIVSRADMDAG